MTFLRFLAATVAIAVMASGCSGTASSVPPAAAEVPGTSFAHFSLLASSAIDPKYLGSIARQVHPERPALSASHAGFAELAVADAELNEVFLFNNSYQTIGTITNGINYPNDDFIDNVGNLYVSQYGTPSVLEYAKGTTSPSFTYSQGLTDPADVTTDAKRNVYVDEYNDGSAGSVLEYHQHTSAAAASCATGLAGEGIAVDSTGDVFLTGMDESTGVGHLIEFKGGLAGCKSKTLKPTFSFPGGLQIDSKNDLVAVDQGGGVYVIPPPYVSAKSSIGAVAPFNIALSKNNELIFITSPNRDQVLVDKYPVGKTITTLGSSDGLEAPVGVATYPFGKKP